MGQPQVKLANSMQCAPWIKGPCATEFIPNLLTYGQTSLLLVHDSYLPANQSSVCP